jgi:hypothetical protein
VAGGGNTQQQQKSGSQTLDILYQTRGVNMQCFADAAEYSKPFSITANLFRTTVSLHNSKASLPAHVQMLLL